jgi:hypothetical protein
MELNFIFLKWKTAFILFKGQIIVFNASTDVSGASGFFFENHFFCTVVVFISYFMNVWKPLNLLRGLLALSSGLSNGKLRGK